MKTTEPTCPECQQPLKRCPFSGQLYCAFGPCDSKVCNNGAATIEELNAAHDLERGRA